MAESLTIPQLLAQFIAENGDYATIPATNDQTEGRASVAYGFPPLTSTPVAEGGKLVRRADMNGLFYLLSQYCLFAQNGGLFTFNQSVSDAIGGYPLGARLVYTDSDGKSHIVRSLIPNNTYNFVSDPSYIDGLKWGYTFVDFDADNVFTSLNAIILRINDLADNAATPASDTTRHIMCQAADGSLFGYTGLHLLANGQIRTNLLARKKVGGTEYNCRISAMVNADGTASTYAPTPASNSKDTSIATTKWISDFLKGNTSVNNGWTYLGNGLVLQWIHPAAISGTNNSSGTLPIAMDSNNYRVVGSISAYSLSSQANGYISTYNYTTTGFKFNSSQNGAVDFFIIGKADTALSALANPKPL